jgi:hypothetical protein
MWEDQLPSPSCQTPERNTGYSFIYKIDIVHLPYDNSNKTPTAFQSQSFPGRFGILSQKREKKARRDGLLLAGGKTSNDFQNQDAT